MITDVEIGHCLLSSILKKKGMTQSDLAVMTGITRQEINSYVHNKRHMSLRTAKRIAIALNCACIDNLYEWKIK